MTKYTFRESKKRKKYRKIFRKKTNKKNYFYKRQIN